MLVAYWQFAETYYCKDGGPTKELECMKEAMWPLSQLYGSTKAVDFGPQALKTVRQHMIGEQGLCRNVANRRIGRIKRVFKWAVAEEVVPPSTYHGLQALAGLRFPPPLVHHFVCLFFGWHSGLAQPGTFLLVVVLNSLPTTSQYEA